MNKVKYLQLIIDDRTEFEVYSIHEGLIEDSFDPYWIGSKPIRTYDSYDAALLAWGTMDRKSAANMDILRYSDVEAIMDRVDYEDNIELDFDK